MPPRSYAIEQAPGGLANLLKSLKNTSEREQPTRRTKSCAASFGPIEYFGTTRHSKPARDQPAVGCYGQDFIAIWHVVPDQADHAGWLAEIPFSDALAGGFSAIDPG